MTEQLDCVVIGAGVIGLACAAALGKTGREVVVLEAANLIGSGTSSRNSEVIHAGIYYPAGSLKARLCRAGKAQLYAYCEGRGVPFKRLGKMVVARQASQLPALARIAESALKNDVRDLVWLSRTELAKVEPCIAGEHALFSPSTGIIDSHSLMLALEADLLNAGGMVVLQAPVLRGEVKADGFLLDVGGVDPIRINAKSLINAAGLSAQQIAQSIRGIPPTAVPSSFFAKGHYYRLSGRAPCSHLIYPLPEDAGLGIHLTLDMGGQAKFGPDVRWVSSIDYTFDDQHFDAFVEAIRLYYPGLDVSRLNPDYTGIRPKLGGPGSQFADFRIDGPAQHGIPGLVNLFGIESPGLTASLAIADYVSLLMNS
ncbi:MAG: NAD(P)/FAD-dependent oxidoreductase [Rhodospirillaceae bacterium]|nr:NAD(P)/FAD-dependent oxidoreductase [Rhodospirillaceae bacterium]